MKWANSASRPFKALTGTVTLQNNINIYKSRTGEKKTTGA